VDSRGVVFILSSLLNVILKNSKQNNKKQGSIRFVVSPAFHIKYILENN